MRAWGLPAAGPEGTVSTAGDEAGVLAHATLSSRPDSITPQRIQRVRRLMVTV